jgi:hypothetical protein
MDFRHHFGIQVVAVHQFMGPMKKFLPQDSDPIGGVEGEAHPIADDTHHGDCDAAPNDDFLARLPTQHKHFDPPLTGQQVFDSVSGQQARAIQRG